jgi:large subunit ribosomal protein L34e
MKDSRITYRRRHSYATKTNRAKAVKTPGGKLVCHYVQKRVSHVKCGDCGGKISGVPMLAPRKFKFLHKRQRRVTRAYGGSRCAGCVRERIVRAFLIEEQKCVKKVLQDKARRSKKKSA